MHSRVLQERMAAFWKSDRSAGEQEAGCGAPQAALNPEVFETIRQPKRPFQGWLCHDRRNVPWALYEAWQSERGMPAELKRELAELGLL
jgi:hypothetical protein